jgi:hypothetical protein
MEEYKVDDSLRHVKLEVRVGLVSVAETRVYKRESVVYKRIIKSEKGANGFIPFTKVGVNSTLDNNTLKIRTFINSNNLTDALKAKDIDNMMIIYSLKGGPDGLVPFEFKESEIDDSDPDVIVVTKMIKFTI